jgi:hypothetical protein
VTSRPRLTQQRLREILHYDPETGEFRWRQRRGNGIRVGEIAGCLVQGGYRCIKISGRSYRSHQLAWLYMIGAWCGAAIDHRDQDPANNSWNNLRQSTPSNNNANRRRHRNNTSGFQGVYLERESGKWVARVRKEGRTHHLGRFVTAQAAHEAYMAAARRLYGRFARAD